MSLGTRSRSGLVCFWLSWLGVYLGSGVAVFGQAEPILDPPLPTPRSMPTGGPVEERAPPPREATGLLGSPPSGPPSEEVAPMPREQTPGPPPLLLPSASRFAPSPETARLHQEIESLRMEREAMFLEELDLITAKESKQSKGDETAQLRRRVTDLLLRAAQQSKKPASEDPPAKPNKKPTSPSKNPSPSAPAPLPSEGEEESKRPRAPVAEGKENKKHPSSSSGGKEVAGERDKPSKQPDHSHKVLTEAPVDPLSLAQSLFLAGDHEAALQAYRQLEESEPKPEARVGIQYMIACCLRKLGKLDEAASLYREVANSGGSDILVENAQWYLRALKDRRELEGQLVELRQRRQALMPRKP